MKFVWFGILIIIVGLGFLGKREARNVSGAPPRDERTETDSRVPTPVGIPNGPPPQPAEARPPHLLSLPPDLTKPRTGPANHAPRRDP